MTWLSVRLRLTLLFAALGLVAGGLTLAGAYLVVDRELAVVPLPQDPAVNPAPTSAAEASAEKARLGQVEYDMRREVRAQVLNPLLRNGTLGVAGLTAASAVIGWMIASGTLRPLRRMTATARRVADRSLHERVALGRIRDEWWELGAAMNAMLSRLDAAFAAQQRFVGNASHELKTPLAINRTLLEVAMGRPDAPVELIRLGETMLEVNARHERVVDGMLALARADHGIAEPRPVDLAEVVEEQLKMLRPEIERAGIAVDRELSAQRVAGDRVLLDRLAQNLLQNAIRHNIAAGWVLVTVDGGPAAARLRVVNSGPKVNPGEVPELFEPFQRAANRIHSARSTGLGLSIVRSVVHAHAGDVQASALADGGLEVAVTIPRRKP